MEAISAIDAIRRAIRRDFDAISAATSADAAVSVNDAIFAPIAAILDPVRDAVSIAIVDAMRAGASVE